MDFKVILPKEFDIKDLSLYGLDGKYKKNWKTKCLNVRNF